MKKEKSLNEIIRESVKNNNPFQRAKLKKEEELKNLKEEIKQLEKKSNLCADEAVIFNSRLLESLKNKNREN